MAEALLVVFFAVVAIAAWWLSRTAARADAIDMEEAWRRWKNRREGR